MDLMMGAVGLRGVAVEAPAEGGVGLSDTGRDYRLGWRLTRDVRDGGSLELSLDATRRESVNDNGPPEHGVGLRLSVRW